MATLPSDVEVPPEADAGLTVAVWAADAARVAALAAAVAGPGRSVQEVLDLGELIRLAYHRLVDALVLEDAEVLGSQVAFLRLPIILVRRGPDGPTPRLAKQAYAIVARPAEAGLAVERLLEHRRLAARAGGRREPPRRCSRCGRGYDPAAGRKGVARRFVRFGQVTLCGACVADLRTVLVHAEAPWVDAGVRA